MIHYIATHFVLLVPATIWMYMMQVETVSAAVVETVILPYTIQQIPLQAEVLSPHSLQAISV